MAKTKQLPNPDARNIAWAIECPGCQMWHSLNTATADPKLPKWDFNGDVEKPTFSPSLLVRYPQDGVEKRCHSFIKNGEIQFLSDCSHDLKGLTVPLPDMD